MNLQKELGELRDEFAGKKAQWDNEKTSVERLQKIREEIEQVNQEIQKHSILTIWNVRQNCSTANFHS